MYFGTFVWQRSCKCVPLPGNEIPVNRIEFTVCKTVKTLDTYIFGNKRGKRIFFSYLCACDYKYQNMPVCNLMRYLCT